MQVIDTLPALRMRVDDGAKTLPCDAFLLSDTFHKPQHLTKESVRCLENSGNPLFGDDQDMHRRLRILVAKRKGILGLGDPPFLRHGLKRELSRIQGSYLFVGDLSDADRGPQHGYWQEKGGVSHFDGLQQLDTTSAITPKRAWWITFLLIATLLPNRHAHPHRNK
nr:hypothetical protein [Azotobacter chroococcum]